MRWFRFVVLVCVVTVLQASLLADLNIKPDLLLILVVFFAIYCNTSKAIITSFTIGFAADIIMVGSAMGPQIISFGLLGTTLAYMHRVITIRKMSYQALVIFTTALVAGLLTHLLGLLKGQPIPPNIYTVLFWTSVCSGLVGPLLFLPSAWWMRIKTDRFGRR